MRYALNNDATINLYIKLHYQKVIMIINFGIKSRQIKASDGVFCCVHCRNHRDYTQYKVQRYASLFFLPIIPLGIKMEYVECQHCHSQYHIEALNLQLFDLILQSAFQNAFSGTSLTVVHQKLLSENITPQDADSIINILKEKYNVMTCKHCQENFLANAHICTCAACGTMMA